MSVRHGNRVEALREEFVARRGYWNDNWQVIVEHDPDFFEAYMNLSCHALERGSLDPKVREYIYIATCATVTHLFEAGLRQHARNALELGATPEELLAVLALVSSVGIQTYHLAVDALEEARPGWAASRTAIADDPDSAAVAAKHERLYGVMCADVERAIDADPAFYDRYLDLAAVSLERSDVLPAKVAHLILLAVHACATGLWRPGVKQHLDAALHHGATPAEVIDVCEQITGMSVHTLSIGVPALFEEVTAFRRDALAEATDTVTST
jgi:alkylhydroperoxidase/carboxymuconolactone decarboxylase family protein YurZ